MAIFGCMVLTRSGRKHESSKHGNRAFRCENAACKDSTFVSRREYERHLKSSGAHVAKGSQEFSDKAYRCWCGRSYIRKDHHIRHLNAKKLCEAVEGILFKCHCGKEDGCREQHLEHAGSCGRQRKGRKAQKNRV